MANENKNINELVSDDDPTAELEAVTFRQDLVPQNEVQRESDEHTSDLEKKVSDDAQTIGRLRYDIEQLRSRWLGLEAEIEAREELTQRLTAELNELRDALARKEKLLKSRDTRIKSLKLEIRDRDEYHRTATVKLEEEISAALKTTHAIPEPPATSPTQPGEVHDQARLERTEAYADALRRKLQDVLASHDDLEREREYLAASLNRSTEQGRQLAEELAVIKDDKSALEQDLAAINDKHVDEMRMLRFELGEAQETVAQNEELNHQLASDLVDTRGFKKELERMLCDNDEQSKARIDELEKQLAKMTRVAKDFEEKLDARSEAINVLLGELARKSEQIESIGEIGEVISDIDVRISEQFDEDEDLPLSSHKAHDRVARVLLGKVGDKLLRFPLFKDRLTIGRTEDNDIQLNAAYISRRHAVVQTDGDATRVIDWGSKNGVYVNSKKVTEHFLKNGDVVTIGNVHFRYDERPKRDN
jgi:hypothetical protein